ncbi:MAG TPA: hypothetical protein VE056_00920 [Pyrinomonadaceae bacterium]|nr:hypothetical protein [Pyrinomonadaceae bacterium]
MSESILSAQPSILACPSCGQMIYSDSAKCRFCSAEIDPIAAAAGAALQKRVNDACNLAKVTRNMAASMWGFFVVSFIFGFARFGVLVLFVGVPVSLVLWQIKYGKLQTTDPDYKKAKRDRWIALALWLPASILQFVVLVLVALL